MDGRLPGYVTLPGAMVLGREVTDSSVASRVASLDVPDGDLSDRTVHGELVPLFVSDELLLPRQLT